MLNKANYPDLNNWNKEYTTKDLFEPFIHEEDIDRGLKYKEDLIHYMAKKYFINDSHSIARATEHVNKSIGYMAGYLDPLQRQVIEEKYGVEHPYFGKIKEMGQPSQYEAYACGILNITLKSLREGYTKEEILKLLKEKTGYDFEIREKESEGL